jgi:hypothetical protein
MKRLTQVVLLLAGALALTAVAGASRGDPLVTVGSPSSPFSQNKQNEPAIAVNPNPVDLTGAMAAGANDNIDEEACNAGDDTTCPFTAGVGGSGIYFSFSGGSSWTQPTYTGWSARGCLGVVGNADPPCSPVAGGPIGTLPNYFENGLVSDGDPEVAFGPQPGADGGFSWSNGTRLYYADLTSNFAAARSEQTIKGFEAIAVSRTDDIKGAAAGDNGAWMNPVIASKQNAALFSDHPTIAVDDASKTSPFFGSVYVCNAAFRSQEIGGFPEPIVLNSSHDGGNTWRSAQLSPSVNNTQITGRQDCQVDTDSKGNVYVVWDGVDNKTKQLSLFIAKSSNGGKSFPGPQQVITPVMPTGIVDPNTGDLTFDGFAGARDGTAPAFSIANGAPTGIGATDELVVAWEQGPTPSNTSPGPNEKADIVWSTDGGSTWSGPVSASPAADRPDFVAIGISPNGRHVDVVYDNFLQPWQSTTSTPRLFQGVVRTAAVGSDGSIGSFSDLDREATGDARASSANAQDSEFLGDYNQIVSTNTFVAAVWNDARRAADCPAEDAYRQALTTSTPLPRPAPEQDCPATFGNTDIFGGVFTR